MGVGYQARRAAQAALGTADWAVEHGMRLWQQRTQWGERAGQAYSELAKRGAALLSRTEADTRSQARRGDRADRERIPGAGPLEGEVLGLALSADQLPLADYDTLTVDQITAELPGLSQHELHQVEGYETAHHARSTVLERIEALRASEPWPGYDEMTVAQILPRLRALADAERADAAAYEARHKQRRTILDTNPPQPQ